ncbi:MAG: hypothetical protein COA79_21060 [Planctomycetota bacterium]|nr:MAG: hypothetical protein COA79_21060 [Planctomycetota bacterium]
MKYFFLLLLLPLLSCGNSTIDGFNFKSNQITISSYVLNLDNPNPSYSIIGKLNKEIMSTLSKTGKLVKPSSHAMPKALIKIEEYSFNFYVGCITHRKDGAEYFWLLNDELRKLFDAIGSDIDNDFLFTIKHKDVILLNKNFKIE